MGNTYEVGRRDGALANLLRYEKKVVDRLLRDRVINDCAWPRIGKAAALTHEDAHVNSLLNDDESEFRLIVIC